MVLFPEAKFESLEKIKSFLSTNFKEDCINSYGCEIFNEFIEKHLEVFVSGLEDEMIWLAQQAGLLEEDYEDR